ncbi:transposase is4 [Holotrichia oblita]|uniref:Transposase is4 n=1 Tax=Holotrichia oblita TaxID=644536 RepID=A0ACB9SKN1_HOLOL|nr:transposase is4 [Holotrichia oblita]
MIGNLSRKKCFVCVTIRQTRKDFPKTVLKPDSKLRLSESDGVIKDEVGISKWKDRGKKSVYVATTMYNALEKTQVLRTQKDGSRILVPCPVAVAEY